LSDLILTDWSFRQRYLHPPFLKLISQTIEQLDIDQAKDDVLPFVREPAVLDVWSRDFFRDIVERVRFV